MPTSPPGASLQLGCTFPRLADSLPPPALSHSASLPEEELSVAPVQLLGQLGSVEDLPLAGTALNQGGKETSNGKEVTFETGLERQGQQVGRWIGLRRERKGKGPEA